MDKVRIGREADNDIVFADKEVSRNHCELYYLNGRVYIRDLDSTNGTQVNGRDINSPTVLKKNDLVVLGHKVKIDWYSIWSQFYSYPINTGGAPETIRYGGLEETMRHDVPSRTPQESSGGSRPLVDIPSSIHIHQDQNHAEIYKSGDDFKVPFKRNLGNNIGHHVGNTLGCIISILIVAAVIAIIALVMS
jgi:hypothetical protein